MHWKHFALFTFAALFCLSTGRMALAQDDFDADADYGDDEDLDAPGGGGGGLMLTAGTMQAGGQIAFQINALRDTGGGGFFSFAPTAGFFIIDHLELLAEVGFATGFGDADFESVQSAYYAGTLDFWFAVGAKYYIPIGALNLYAGALIGMDFLGFDTIDETGESDRAQQNSMQLSVPVGILLALNQHIGLDIGARFNFHIGLGEYDTFFMSIPIGYFGIQGFFNLGG